MNREGGGGGRKASEKGDRKQRKVMERHGGKGRCAQEEVMVPLPSRVPTRIPAPSQGLVFMCSCSGQAHRNVSRLSRHCSPAVHHTLGWASSHSSGPHTGR